MWNRGHSTRLGWDLPQSPALSSGSAKYPGLCNSWGNSRGRGLNSLDSCILVTRDHSINWTGPEAPKYRRRSSGANGGEDWRGDFRTVLLGNRMTPLHPSLFAWVWVRISFCSVWSARRLAPTAAPHQRTRAGRDHAARFVARPPCRSELTCRDRAPIALRGRETWAA